MIDDAGHGDADAGELSIRLPGEFHQFGHGTRQQVGDLVRVMAVEAYSHGGDGVGGKVGCDALHRTHHQFEADRKRVFVVDIHGDRAAAGEAGYGLPFDDDAFLQKVGDDEGDGRRT